MEGLRFEDHMVPRTLKLDATLFTRIFARLRGARVAAPNWAGVFTLRVRIFLFAMSLILRLGLSW